MKYIKASTIQIMIPVAVFAASMCEEIVVNCLSGIGPRRCSLPLFNLYGRPMTLDRKIETVLKNADLQGFTELLIWDRLHRYVVWLIDNKEWTLNLLVAQSWSALGVFNSVTIGGWTNPHWDILIDIGTSTDDLQLAKSLQKRFNQQCIRDTIENKEIW